LSQTLWPDSEQRTEDTPAYTALNGVMKDAAARRQAIRQQMQASAGGGFTPGQEPTPSSARSSTAWRAEMKGFRLKRTNGTRDPQ